MKIAGHTMGTPEYTVSEAIALMERIGADGIEIVVQDGYKSGIPTACDPKEIRSVRELCRKHRLEVSCLTPYNSYFNSLDEAERQGEIAAIRRVIGACETLDAHFIRLYGGNLAAGDTDHVAERRERLVASLREMGDEAEAHGVTLLVENHFNTMAVSAKDSAALMRDVGHPAVRILYDQANLTFTGNEDYREAIRLQQEYVAYMHVKDLVFIEGKSFVSGEVSHPREEDRNVVTKIVGEGVVPWREILSLVKSHGYDGWLSLEYERRWHPKDIPDASIGMKQSIEFLRRILAELG